jgi:hypothetical protein
MEAADDLVRSPVRLIVARVLWVLAAIVVLLLHSRFRLLPDVWLIACVVAWWIRPRLRRVWLPLVALAGWFLVHASPYDVSWQTAPGGPRFMRLVMGYPAQETISAAERGELILGGCVVGVFEPRWILVW